MNSPAFSVFFSAVVTADSFIPDIVEVAQHRGQARLSFEFNLQVADYATS
jgi:hypothetical protein